MPRLRCGLVGCGTVGSGVVRLWAQPGQADEVDLTTVAVRDVGKPRAVDLSGRRVTADALALVRDPGVDLVIEATGDTGLGRALALETLARGKPFVTAGKALVVRHGEELERLAAAHGTSFLYEAAAGGALPIVALLRLGLSPGPVRGFEAVLSGTCNFVLTRLAEGVGYEEALAQAREAGLAEPDSTRDVSGQDAADKLLLLARLLGVRLEGDRLPRRGIVGLGPHDAAFARRRGLALRLVARLRLHDHGAEAWLAPVLVPAHSPLAQARDEQNVVMLDAGAAGPVALSGAGAGSLPTAAAILSDVRELARSFPRGRAMAARATRALPVLADGRARRHYVTVCGSSAARQAALRALAAEGVAVEGTETPWRGRLQVLTTPADPARVARALAGLENALALAIHDEEAESASPAGSRSGQRVQPALEHGA
jgi:homoserine dehydrogenase